MVEDLSIRMKEHMKQYKVRDLIKYYTDSGFDKKSIYFSLFKLFLPKILLVIGIIILLVILVPFIIGLVSEGNVESESRYRPIINDSDKFTHEKLFDSVLKNDDGDIFVSIGEVTDHESYYTGYQQNYDLYIANRETIFSYDGSYKGYFFPYNYTNETGSVKMKISNDIDPDDGVIEGFIFAKINDEELHDISLYIMVDQDWRLQVNDTKIFWGSNYQYYMNYSFDNFYDGIYIMEIMDDPARHSDNFTMSFGGVLVGDINVSNIVNDDLTNKTFMRFS